MRKNTTTPLMKACIMEGLLLLLQERSLDEISVTEIVEKAGVNRSTYYRHFQSKQDIIRYFYDCRLGEALGHASGETELTRYFAEIFTSFLAHRQELILLDRLGLSYLLLDQMNKRIGEIYSFDNAVQQLYCCYHIGGVFNSFRFWLRENMTTPPEVLASQCVQILPKDFSPRLKEPLNPASASEGLSGFPG